MKACSAQHLRKPFSLIPEIRNLLTDGLKANGHTTTQSVGDADVDIISSVLDIACEGKNITLVGADLDPLILLLYMWNDSIGSMTMKCEGTKKYSQITRNIGETAKCLTQIKYLTFIYAFRVCDTTTATDGLGKISIIKTIEKKKMAKDTDDVFLSPKSTQDDIVEAGPKLFVTLYGGKAWGDLPDLRYSKYRDMAAKPTKIKPEPLPPTKRAAHLHSLCVYLQLHERNNLNSEDIKPEDCD